ncbi:low temperature requirement protein A [Glycomyces arizonensis]|uniref:low temperature requirement protein A n=1 Tax=Glycomyces arizonensis TaxID=256035 RepID=UPI0004786FD5|nr:low temperature requirement protein A [Glycomyces arizonensis]
MSTAPPSPPRWHRPMAPRRADEAHRVATPLELLYDLVFVVAIAQAAAGLHHALAEGHWQTGLVNYAMVFFAIWWTWLNFAWFASAYDTDDTPYRIAVMVQMAGALILAAGIESAFEHREFLVVTIGYTVIRLAMVPQWLRAAHSDPARRTTCRRYAAGVTAVQVCWWIAALAVPDTAYLYVWMALVVFELLVPVYAERAETTTWHPHHIAERYSLFTIIVLGETVLASTLAVKAAFATGHDRIQVLVTAAAGLVVLFSMWWLYFDRPVHDLLTNLRMGFRWGYGHYLVFASAAAVGAGTEIAVESIEGEARLGPVASAAPVAVAVAVYVLSVWVLQVLPRGRGPLAWAYPLCAVLVLASMLVPWTLAAIALLMAGLVAWTVTVNHREAARGSAT